MLQTTDTRLQLEHPKMKTLLQEKILNVIKVKKNSLFGINDTRDKEYGNNSFTLRHIAFYYNAGFYGA